MNKSKFEKSNQEQLSRKQKLARFGGNVAMAGLVIIPVADYATSDIVSAKVYNTVQNEVSFENKAAKTAAVDALIGLGIAAQCVALSTAFTRSKKLSGIKNDFEDYLAEREGTMSTPRKIVSKTVNAPYAGIVKLGTGFEKLGQKIEDNTQNKVLKSVGQVIVDAGKVNAMGPPMAAMQETINGKPPSFAKNAYYGGLFAGGWIGAAEGIRQVYRNVGFLRPPMALIGETFQTLTSIDNPIGITALSSAAVGLAVTGWRVAEFHRQKEAEMAPEAAEFPPQLLPFPEANA
jgi:hypothetical protein